MQEGPEVFVPLHRHMMRLEADVAYFLPRRQTAPFGARRPSQTGRPYLVLMGIV